jgi:uncharacterized membrane protein YkvA (DUF1232 family)
MSVPDEFRCPICMDTMKYAAQFECGHAFCGDCLLTAYERAATCPVCRMAVKNASPSFNLREAIRRWNEEHPDDEYIVTANGQREVDDRLRVVGESSSWSSMFSNLGFSQPQQRRNPPARSSPPASNAGANQESSSSPSSTAAASSDVSAEDIARAFFANHPDRGKVWLFAFLIVIYVIFPIDLIPDIIPILGWVDDAAIFAFCSYNIMRIAQRQRHRH